VPDFAGELGLWEVQVTVPTAFPGTPLHERLDIEELLFICGPLDLEYLRRWAEYLGIPERPAERDRPRCSRGLRSVTLEMKTSGERSERSNAASGTC
jgi:hypothetical protein